MKVAIVHDWLVQWGGGENVLRDMLDVWPNSDLYTVIDKLSDQERKKIDGRRAKTTFLQRFPRIEKNYRSYLPLMTFAVEQLDLSGYDVIISSSHAVAKGVLTGPDQLHICYCHSPVRYAWDLQHQYLRESNLENGFKSLVARYILHKVRIWDTRTSAGVDYFIANSEFIGRRIMKSYRRASTVIYPGVNLDAFEVQGVKSETFITASRMVPYKKMDLIVRAFAELPTEKLIVIGDGPQLNKLREIATPNVQILGYQPFDVLRSNLASAAAFIFAAEEDFGILPVEAQACGTPVIAYGKGGALETVIPGVTGVLFNEQTSEAIREAILSFKKMKFDSLSIRSNAEKFTSRLFKQRLKEFVETRWLELEKGKCQ